MKNWEVNILLNRNITRGLIVWKNILFLFFSLSFLFLNPHTGNDVVDTGNDRVLDNLVKWNLVTSAVFEYRFSVLICIESVYLLKII